MITQQELQEIKDRLNKATRGPWYWNMNTKHKSLRLASKRGWDNIVMDFERWGMHSAIPRFNKDGILYKANEFAISKPGLEHHIGYDLDINHPDAQFIAHAPNDIKNLIETIEILMGKGGLNGTTG